MGDQTMRRAILVLTACAGFVLAPAVRADELALGTISFNNPLPGSTNSFDITNISGDTTGFYTSTAATFMNATLTLSDGEVIVLGDIAAQDSITFPDLPAVQFPAADTFTSAEFKATLDVTNFLLPDGTTFTGSSTIDTLMLPSSGNDLVAGTDFAIINASSAPNTVSEPAVWLTGAPLFWLFRKVRRATPPV